jgi:hypothetical protein
MKGTIANIKQKYLDIKARYVALDKKDELGRPIYTYTNIVAKIAKEFYLQERTVGEILLLDIDKWEKKERKSVPAQMGLFDDKKEEQ